MQSENVNNGDANLDILEEKEFDLLYKHARLKLNMDELQEKSKIINKRKDLSHFRKSNNTNSIKNKISEAR